MRFLSVREEDYKVCRRACLIAVWVQLLFTAVMTISVLVKWVYAVLAALLAAVLLLSLAWDSKTVRIIIRVLTGIPLLIYAFLLVDLILAAVDGWHFTSFAGWVASACNLVVPMAAWIAPGTAAIALKRGRYDRTVMCIGQILLIACGAVAAFWPTVRDVYQWTFPTAVVLTVWFIIAVVSTVISVACALLRPQKEVEIEGSSLGLETEE